MAPIKAIDSERMRDNFSSHAGDYDGYASVQKRVAELLCARVSGIERKPGPLLDIGTGTGALAAAILRAEPDHQLVIMDIAHGMTCAAASRLSVASACDGDASVLPFVDEAFARVVSSSVYQWVACLPTAFAEVFRVLKPGGLFAMALFGDRTLCELRDSHSQAVAEKSAGQTSHVQSFPTTGEVCAAVGSAGLLCRELYSAMEVEYHSDVSDLLRHLKKIGANNAATERPRGLASRLVMQSMMRMYEERHRCDAGLPASYEVIVVIAEKPGYL
jgi:malonyl-CoA O-methyltransferase